MWDWANLRGDPAPRRVPPRGEPAPRGGDPAPLEGELAPLLLHALRSRLRLGSWLRRGGEPAPRGGRSQLPGRGATRGAAGEPAPPRGASSAFGSPFAVLAPPFACTCCAGFVSGAHKIALPDKFMNSGMRWERPANKSGTARATLKFQLRPTFQCGSPKRGASSPGGEPAPRGGEVGRKRR